MFPCHFQTKLNLALENNLRIIFGSKHKKLRTSSISKHLDILIKKELAEILRPLKFDRFVCTLKFVHL